MRKLVLTCVLGLLASAGGCTTTDRGEPDLGTKTSELVDLNACLSQSCPWTDCPASGCWAVYTDELCYCLADGGDHVLCNRGALAAMRECIRSTPF